MTTKRSKGKVMEKILNLGLVEDRKDLYKRRGSKAARRSRRGRGGDSSDDGKCSTPCRPMKYSIQLHGPLHND